MVAKGRLSAFHTFYIYEGKWIESFEIKKSVKAYSMTEFVCMNREESLQPEHEIG